MPRKMIVHSADGASTALVEAPADNEAQLQELVKNNPDLLPIEEFGMTGPLLVVGRETTLPSGSVDLAALARSGELLIVEFKTGPQNTDFRRVLVQLLDYGSDIWQMTYEEFERTVPVRYFHGQLCQDARTKGLDSLEEAARAVWTDLSDEDVLRLREQLTGQLADGTFYYVVVAQRFVTTVERTLAYLNATTRGARFYAVEVVRFTAGGMTAFESRTVLRPATTVATPAAAYLNEADFLDTINDEAYRAALHELFEVCRGFGLRFEWGAAGTSIRVQTGDRPEPLTVAWLYPPGRNGWMGLRDLTLGFDRSSAVHTPSAQPALENYLAAVMHVEGTDAVKTKLVSGYRLAPEVVAQEHNQIADILAELVRQVNEGSP